MKKIVIAFSRQRYSSASNGGPTLFLMDERLMALIGGANDMRWELTTYATSGGDARALVTLSEGTKSDSRPSANIFSGTGLTYFPSASPTPAPMIGVAVIQVNGPFSGLVDGVLKIWDINNTSLQWVDMEVRLTLIFHS